MDFGFNDGSTLQFNHSESLHLPPSIPAILLPQSLTTSHASSCGDRLSIADFSDNLKIHVRPVAELDRLGALTTGVSIAPAVGEIGRGCGIFGKTPKVGRKNGR